MLAKESVEWNGCKTASNDQSIHSELQIAILLFIFALSLFDFKLLVVKGIA